VKQNTKIELRQSLGLTYGNPVSLNCVHSATQTLVTHGTPEGAQMNVKRSTNTELRQSLGFSIASNTQYKHSWYLIVNLAESGGIESDNRARDLNLTIVFVSESGSDRIGLQLESGSLAITQGVVNIYLPSAPSHALWVLQDVTYTPRLESDNRFESGSLKQA